MLTRCWPHADIWKHRHPFSLAHVHNTSIIPCAAVDLITPIISFDGGVLSQHQKCTSACASQDPQFDQTRVEPIRSLLIFRASLCLRTFVHGRLDSYDPCTRRRGQLKAVCQPDLRPMSLRTKQHFTTTMEAVQCNTSLWACQAAECWTLVSVTLGGSVWAALPRQFPGLCLDIVQKKQDAPIWKSG